MSKVICMGGCGFIGSHLVNRLLNEDHEVVVVDDLSTGFLEYLPKNKNLKFIKCDISRWDDLSKNFAYFQGADTLFHLSAKARIQPSIYNPFETHETNVTGTLNILQMMRMCNIKNIVYSASSSSYGPKAKIPCVETDPYNNQTPYAVTKVVGELFCKTWGNLFGINNICLKYFNVWGERSPTVGQYAPIIGLFYRQVLQDKTPMTIIGNGQQRRDMTFVSDVVNANILAMNNLTTTASATGETINIGTGRNFSINEIANLIQNNLSKRGIKSDIVFIPERPGESLQTLADINKAKALLNWEPSVKFEDKIDEIADYYINLFKET